VHVPPLPFVIEDVTARDLGVPSGRSASTMSRKLHAAEIDGLSDIRFKGA
jgi:hypothetical protein